MCGQKSGSESVCLVCVAKRKEIEWCACIKLYVHSGNGGKRGRAAAAAATEYHAMMIYVRIDQGKTQHRLIAWVLQAGQVSFH